MFLTMKSPNNSTDIESTSSDALNSNVSSFEAITEKKTEKDSKSNSENEMDTSQWRVPQESSPFLVKQGYKISLEGVVEDTTNEDVNSKFDIDFENIEFVDDSCEQEILHGSYSGCVESKHVSEDSATKKIKLDLVESNNFIESGRRSELFHSEQLLNDEKGSSKQEMFVHDWRGNSMNDLETDDSVNFEFSSDAGDDMSPPAVKRSMINLPYDDVNKRDIRSSWSLQTIQYTFKDLPKSHSVGSISSRTKSCGNSSQEFLRRNSGHLNFTPRNAVNVNSVILADNVDLADNLDNEETFLCVFLGGNRLGAALYDSSNYKLSLFKDLPDSKPSFDVLSQLIRQSDPDNIICSSKQDDRFKSFLQCVCGVNLVNSEASLSDCSKQGEALRKPHLIVRPSIDFSYQVCRRRFQNLHLSTRSQSVDWQRIRMSSYLDFNSESMVRAVGALTKYLEQNLGPGLNLDQTKNDFGECKVMQIEDLSLENILWMNESALLDLQIFCSTQQQSGSSSGSWNKKREGLSLLSFMNRCHTVVGSRFLQRFLRCPSADIYILLKRQKTVEFLVSPQNKGVVEDIVRSLRSIKNIHRLLKKLDSNNMSVVDWLSLYKTLGGMISVAQVAARHRDSVPHFDQICNVVNQNVYKMRAAMGKVFDFDLSKSTGVMQIRAGVSQILDEKKNYHSSLPGYLSIVAKEVSSELPVSGVNVCTVTYIPQVGFVVVIPSEETEDILDIPGFTFVFENNGAQHYKNTRMLELDKTFGDIFLDIGEIESKIVLKLTEVLLKDIASLEDGISLVAQLDCLLSLSITSLENNWKKPILVEDGKLEIEDGRHPLQELTVPSFIANSAQMGEDSGRIHVISGQNSSGKSVYIKQIGLIVYLGQLGCWVPAASAKIPVLKKIFTRIQTVESVSLGLSSFLCDINQVSSALIYGEKKSLLLIDEFGKGTIPVDGMALLMGVISTLVERGMEAPLALFSSHFHEVFDLMPSHSNLLKILKMSTETVNGKVVFLYKAVEGRCKESGSLEILKNTRIKSAVVERAAEVIEAIKTRSEIKVDPQIVSMEAVQNLVKDFLELNLSNNDEDINMMNAFICKILELKL